MTVFVPVTVAEARALRSTGAALEFVGYADGPGLRAWLGEARLDDEEADYVALNHAGVAALLLEGSSTRLVLAVDQDVRSDDALGSVSLAAVDWQQVRSLFADDATAAETVAAARRAVVGLDLAQALVVPEVEALQDAYDLLWYAPEELDALADPA